MVFYFISPAYYLVNLISFNCFFAESTEQSKKEKRHPGAD
jgi:hypothetical protein